MDWTSIILAVGGGLVTIFCGVLGWMLKSLVNWIAKVNECVAEMNVIVKELQADSQENKGEHDKFWQQHQGHKDAVHKLETSLAKFEGRFGRGNHGTEHAPA